MYDNNLGNTDWGAIFDKAASAYSAYNDAKLKAKAEARRIKAEQAALLPPPNFLPQAGAGNLMPILLIGGAGLLLFMLMKRR